MNDEVGLTASEIDHFIEHGYVYLRDAIPQKFVNDWWSPRELFLRSIQLDTNLSHLYLPVVRRAEINGFVPHVWTAICQLLGGREKISSTPCLGDGFTIALPNQKPIFNDKELQQKFPWHKDGFFRHFLDSPNVGLIMIVLWTEVTEENGATALANGSVKLVSRELIQRPAGVPPDYFENYKSPLLNSNFTRITGQPGDICFLHPFLLHAIRPNLTTNFRAITNPSISLRNPMIFNRSNTSNHSPVERSVLKALGVDQLDFKITERRSTGEATAQGDYLTQMRQELYAQILEFNKR